MTTSILENTKSISWSRITIYSTSLFIALMTLLHFTKPDLDPTWRMISKYAIGKNGWMMSGTFIFWVMGWAGLAIQSKMSTLTSKIGLIALWISALGYLLTGIFTTDPVKIGKDEVTTSGMWHSFGGMLGMAMPLDN